MKEQIQLQPETLQQIRSEDIVAARKVLKAVPELGADTTSQAVDVLTTVNHRLAPIIAEHERQLAEQRMSRRKFLIGAGKFGLLLTAVGVGSSVGLGVGDVVFKEIEVEKVRSDQEKQVKAEQDRLQKEADNNRWATQVANNTIYQATQEAINKQKQQEADQKKLEDRKKYEQDGFLPEVTTVTSLTGYKVGYPHKNGAVEYHRGTASVQTFPLKDGNSLVFPGALNGQPRDADGRYVDTSITVAQYEMLDHKKTIELHMTYLDRNGRRATDKQWLLRLTPSDTLDTSVVAFTNTATNEIKYVQFEPIFDNQTDFLVHLMNKTGI